MDMKQTIGPHAVSVSAALFAMGAAGVAVNAQTQPANPPPPAGAPAPADAVLVVERSLPTNDAEFVQMLSAANTTEMSQAKFIVNRTASPAVRTFAQQMIDDHSMAAVKLQAATRGITPETPPARATTPAAMRSVEVLAMLSPQQRDAAYMRGQVGAHRRTIALLQWESEKGKIASLKALAVEMLPTVTNHARMAMAYQATGTTTMAIDSFGPAPGPTGVVSPTGMPVAPATPAPAAPARGAESGAGASRSTNTVTSPSRPPTLAQPTPGPNQPASPAPSPTPY
jgi:putative membrane protein